MGSRRGIAAVAVTAIVIAACAESPDRSIVAAPDGYDLKAAVEAAGGHILSQTEAAGNTVTAVLDRRQRNLLRDQGVPQVTSIGGVRWRVYLPSGEALLEYQRGDILRDGEGETPPAGTVIVYLLDGHVSRSHVLQGPELHPGGPERCSDHGDLVADIVTESTRRSTIVSIPVLCDNVDREAVLLALEWILNHHPEGGRGIINASFTLTDGEDVRRALQAVEEAGILVTWAAGNRGRDACDGYQTPRSSSIILVGAGINGEHDPRSNRGECVDLWVDGERRGEELTHWGTSVAAPRAASTLANLWESMPHLSGPQVRDLYLQNGTFLNRETGARWAPAPVPNRAP